MKRILLLSIILLLTITVMSAQTPKMIISSNAASSTHGLYVFEYNAEDGSLVEVNKTNQVTNSSYHNIHPNRDLIYSVASDEVRAFTFNPVTGSLTMLNSQSTISKGPCYVSVDQTGRFVFVANYGGGGIASFRIKDDGSLTEAIMAIQHDGSSVDKSRQESAHPHLITASPGNNFVMVPDLGMDQVVIYRLDRSSGKLEKHGHTDVAPGAGPRHLEFHPNKAHMYLLNELNSTVGAYHWDEEKGGLKEIATYKLLPENFDAFSKAADIHLTANGKYLYASNRGHNSLAAFKVQNDGTLSFIDHFDVQGDWPRNFFISPDDQYLYVANRRSDSVVQFKINGANGRLDYQTTYGNLPGALCIKMAY